EKFI
ncbi:hypothetical protein D030_0234B, partial [Vibrio parahaemolyticus AQ3810]